MEIILLFSFGTCVVFTTLIIGCLSCKRKLTDEELQQKYFKKFSKRHMIKNSYLSNRVDYVRSYAEAKNVSQNKNERCHKNEEMMTSGDTNPPVVNAEDISSPPKSDYSFFDDSFQTVIEVSGSNMSSINNGEGHHLVVSKDQNASYLSLHNSESQSCLRTGSSSQRVTSETEGEVNAAFSDRPSSLACNSESTCSLFDSYIVPNTGPKIHIIQPSIKRKTDNELTTLNTVTMETNELQLHVKLLETNAKRKLEQNINLNSNSSECFNKGIDVSVRSDKVDGSDLHACERIENVKEKRLKNISVEGQIYNKGKHSSKNTTYEKLHSSKTEQYIYKSLNKTSLVLPGRPKMCSPLVTPARSRMVTPGRSRSEEKVTPKRSKQTFSTGSGYSDHTYDRIDSITSELSHEMNRRDSLASVENDYDSAYGNMRTGHSINLRTPSHRGSYTDGQNNLNASSPEHTYESISTPFSVERMKDKTCENSAVIIGHRTSFDKHRFSKHIQNKFKQKRQEESSNQAGRILSVSDSAERYSPFPVAKKLAFKPAFRQTASPRFSMTQTLKENVTCQLGYPTKMFVDDVNIKTPEIKVDNCSQFFDDTAFISQDILNANTMNKNEKYIDTLGFLQPLSRYTYYQSVESDLLSKVNWSNLKTSHAEKNMYCNKSLPSLSDQLEEEIELHCNANMYTRSTPCDLDIENSNFF